VFVNCKKSETRNETSTVLFTGHFDDAVSNITLSKKDVFSDEEEVHLVEIDSAGHFDYSIALDFPQTIFFGITSTMRIPVFVSPKDTITIEYDENIEVNFSNPNHQEVNNNLKFIQYQIQKTINEDLNPTILRELSEAKFKMLLDSVNHTLILTIDSFSGSNNLNNIEKQELKNEIDFFIVSTTADYEFLNQYIFNQKRNIPNEYYCLIDTLVKNINEIRLTQNALDFLNRIQMRYSNPITNESAKEILELDSSVLRDIILCRAIYTLIASNEFPQAKNYMEKYYPAISSTKLKTQFTAKYEESLAIFNNPSLNSARLQSFTQIDKTGILKELKEKYKNKVLYLKFWAPYCGPCMAQLPYIKIIEEKINPKKFLVINLCAPYPKDKWKATIRENKMAGVHYLLSENQYAELQALFNIQGIPRYVLIDANGEIIDENAPAPGDEMLNGTNFDLINVINNMIKKE
jgi:thiol-disulfide isomerase/thioredoxin